MELISGPKEPKPAKAPPTRDQAAEAARKRAEDDEKKRALLSRGAQGTIFAGQSTYVADSSAPRQLTGM